ncbi:hypothetical protein [Crocosphaera sp. Alani8]|uniref:hypothetical protein n=1 Tax=Crocosphaera sp. Alani8 TaxID=3038952 RepID=UPI00313EC09E
MRKQETEEILLIKLCKGLVDICDRIDKGEPAYLVNDYQPFPQPLYEAFEQLSIKWILRDRKMRHPSILSMVEAARKSVEAVEPDFCQWVDFPDEPLIEDMTKPSEECEDYAIEYSLSLEIDNNQSYIPRLMEEITKYDLPYQTYSVFRRFIAEHPFPCEFDEALLIEKYPEIKTIKDLLEEAYQETPSQSNDKPLCKKCGGYLYCAAREIKGCCEPLDQKIYKAPTSDTVRCLIIAFLGLMRYT